MKLGLLAPHRRAALLVRFSPLVKASRAAFVAAIAAHHRALRRATQTEQDLDRAARALDAVLCYALAAAARSERAQEQPPTPDERRAA